MTPLHRAISTLERLSFAEAADARSEARQALCGARLRLQSAIHCRVPGHELSRQVDHAERVMSALGV